MNGTFLSRYIYRRAVHPFGRVPLNAFALDFSRSACTQLNRISLQSDVRRNSSCVIPCDEGVPCVALCSEVQCPIGNWHLSSTNLQQVCSVEHLRYVLAAHGHLQSAARKYVSTMTRFARWPLCILATADCGRIQRAIHSAIHLKPFKVAQSAQLFM